MSFRVKTLAGQVPPIGAWAQIVMSASGATVIQLLCDDGIVRFAPRESVVIEAAKVEYPAGFEEALR